jgi:hypothetical protein
VRLSEDYASRARSEIDTDEPSVDALQALLLLVTAFTAAGKGKKAYMLLSKDIHPVCSTLVILTYYSKRRWYGHGTRAT